MKDSAESHLATPTWLIAAVVVGILLFAGPPGAPQALAQTDEPESESGDPSEIAREGLEKIMRALGLMIENIPQYEMPELLDNGDIIIRRKKPGPEEEEPEPTFKETNA